MTAKEIQDRFDEVQDSVKNDDEVMLKVLLLMFGNVRGLWDVIHEDVTCLSHVADYDYTEMDLQVECLESLERSFDSTMNAIVEKELLDHDPINK